MKTTNPKHLTSFLKDPNSTSAQISEIFLDKSSCLTTCDVLVYPLPLLFSKASYMCRYFLLAFSDLPMVFGTQALRGRQILTWVNLQSWLTCHSISWKWGNHSTLQKKKVFSPHRNIWSEKMLKTFIKQSFTLMFKAEMSVSLQLPTVKEMFMYYRF